MDKQKQIEEMANAVELADYKCKECRIANELHKTPHAVKECYNCEMEKLIDIGYGNLKDFAERILNVLDNKMSNLKKCEDNLNKEGNYAGAELMSVRYWEIHDVKSKIEKVTKEYTDNE